MKNFSIIAVLIVLFAQSVKGQFVGEYTQYMIVKSAYNPGAIALTDMASASAIHHQQWVGFPGAPMDTYLSFNMPFSLWKKHQIGAGIMLQNKKMGLFSEQTVELAGSYKFALFEGMLSVGTNVGMVNVSFAGDSVKIPKGDNYHTASDPFIPTSRVNGMAFDVSLGAFYTANTWYAGVSVLNITSPTIRWSDTQSTYVGRMLYLMGGYDFSLSNPSYVFKPSMLIKTNFITYQADVNLVGEYQDKYWGGVGFRVGDAFMILAGVRLANGLSIGYSFDLPLTQIITSSYGSHELTLTYDFKLSFDKRNSKYKSVRLL